MKTLTLTNYGVSVILTLYQCDWYHPAPLKKLLTSITNKNLSQNKSVVKTCNKMEESKKNHLTQSGTVIQCINRPLL